MSKELPGYLILATFSNDLKLVRVLTQNQYLVFENRAKHNNGAFFSSNNRFYYDLNRIYCYRNDRHVFALLNPVGLPIGGMAITIDKTESELEVDSVDLTRIHANFMPIAGPIFRWFLIDMCGLDEIELDGGVGPYWPEVSFRLGIPRPVSPHVHQVDIQNQKSLSKISDSSTLEQMTLYKEIITKGYSEILVDDVVEIRASSKAIIADLMLTNSGIELSAIYHPQPTEDEDHWYISFDDEVTFIGSGPTFMSAAIDANLFTYDWERWHEENTREGTPVVPMDMLLVFQALNVESPFLKTPEELIAFLEASDALHTEGAFNE